MDQAVTGTDERKEKIGLAFFWLLVLAYGFFVPSIASWNTESHLYPAFAMVDHHTWRIDAYHQGLGDKSYYKGHYYSDKAPGLAIMAVPVYSVMRLMFPNIKVRGFLLYKHIKNYYYIPGDLAYLRYGITYLLVSLPSAALALLMWLFLMRVTSSPGWSLVLAATYALGTVAYVYSIWYFSHQICAVLLFAAFFLLFMYVRHRPPDRRSLLTTGGAGVLAGFSIISEYPTVVIVGILVVYLLAIAKSRWLFLGAFALGMLPAALLNLSYNLACFGKPFANGYMYVNSDSYKAHVSGGPFGLANPLSYAAQMPTVDSAWQITFGTFRGIFLLCPVLLLFVPGLIFMRRRLDLRPEWWLCLAAVAVYFLMDASRGADANGWSGGASVASRHLTPMLPFMILPIIFGLRDRIFRIVFAALSAVSIAVMFMTVSSTYLFQYTDKNPIVHSVIPNFFHGRIEPNWVYLWRSTFGLTGFASLLPFFISVAILVARISWLLRSGPPLEDDRATQLIEAEAGQPAAS